MHDRQRQDPSCRRVGVKINSFGCCKHKMPSENDMENEDERGHWWMVMRVFLFYSEFVETEIDRRQRHLNKLSDVHIKRLPSITFDKLGKINDACHVNQEFFDAMVRKWRYLLAILC